MSSQVFSIPKDGDFTTSLEHLCQCLATLTAFDLKMGFSTLALLAFLWEESGSIFLPFCHQLFIGEVPLSLLLSRLGTPCFLSFLPACQVLLSSPPWEDSLQEVQLLGAQPRSDGHWDVPAVLVGREAALCSEDTLLAPAQLWVQQEPQGLFCRAASQPAGPQPILPQGHWFAFPFFCGPSWDSSWPVAPSEKQLIHLVAQPHLPICPVCAFAQGALLLQPCH